MKLLLNKALFLDLDGTVIKTKSGKTFPINIDDWEFVSGVLPAIKRYTEQGYYVLIVTNQGGIELGHITAEDIDQKLTTISQEIEQYVRAEIGFLYCAFMEGYDRKPNPGMAYKYAILLNLNLKESVMVGDMPTDEQFAINAGIGTFYWISDFIKDNK